MLRSVVLAVELGGHEPVQRNPVAEPVSRVCVATAAATALFGESSAVVLIERGVMVTFEPWEMGKPVLKRVDGCVERGEVEHGGVDVDVVVDCLGDFLLAGTSHVVKYLVEYAVGGRHVAELGSYVCGS